MLGKQLLPWFGGTSAVWTTCLLFFQAALLAGYAWAHLLAARLSRRAGSATRTCCCSPRRSRSWPGGPFAWPSPITPGERREAGGARGADPRRSSACWPRRSACRSSRSPPRARCCRPGSRGCGPDRRPSGCSRSRTPARSLGLVGYPLVVEPMTSVRTQGWLWSAAFAAYAAGVAWCAVAAGHVTPRSPASRCDEGSAGGSADPSSPGRRARRDDVAPLGATGVPQVVPGMAATLWLALAFFPSVMLAAVTSHLTQEVAAVPFLWMLPLALYLLTFILSFAWPDAGRVGVASRAGGGRGPRPGRPARRAGAGRPRRAWRSGPRSSSSTGWRATASWRGGARSRPASPATTSRSRPAARSAAC